MNGFYEYNDGEYFGDYEDYEVTGVYYEFNDAGPVYGPNMEWQLDPDLSFDKCGNIGRPVFATCKNNCPGGELISFPCFYKNYVN